MTKQTDRKRKADKNRPSSRQRGYTRRWEKARAAFLREHPLCVLCQAIGRTTPATVLDHRIPHKGSQELFWDRANWMQLCAPCHNSFKQKLEKTGIYLGADEDGIPLDPRHHWK
jgi:5-methylcytosine-specific restriction endonuclease McrA